MLQAAVLVVAAVGVLTVAAHSQAPIRSGVELVAVDVHVVERGGEPIADCGVEAGDFEVFIDGRRRDVLSAEFIRYDAGTAVATPSAPAATSGAPTAVARPRRMFIIAVDEHSIRIGAARAATDAARRFIDRLGPDDRRRRIPRCTRCTWTRASSTRSLRTAGCPRRCSGTVPCSPPGSRWWPAPPAAT